MSKKLKPPPDKFALDRPYVPGDPIPVPEAVEHSSDTTWNDWSELHEKHEARFAATEPASLAMRLPDEQRPYAPTVPAPLAPVKAADPFSAAQAARPRAVTYDQVMVEVRKNNRVCPKPEHWWPIYDLLPDRTRTERGPEPSQPLSGAAWKDTPSLAKRMVFREHVEWAAAHSALDAFYAAIGQLEESDWHHMGD